MAALGWWVWVSSWLGGLEAPGPSEAPQLLLGHVQVSSHVDEFVPFPAVPKPTSLGVRGMGQPVGLEHCLLELQHSWRPRGWRNLNGE